jgi:hypothetical protein
VRRVGEAAVTATADKKDEENGFEANGSSSSPMLRRSGAVAATAEEDADEVDDEDAVAGRGRRWDVGNAETIDVLEDDDAMADPCPACSSV